MRTVVGGAKIGGDRRPLAGSWQLFLEEALAALREATKVAEHYGISLAVENHQDLASEELLWLCESIGSPHFGITLDTGNPLATAEHPLDFFRSVAPHVKNVHLKDYWIYLSEEGYRLVAGSSSAILEMAATVALSHQEKWDGSGYPRGLKGEAIPIEGRIVAVADVFDALTSDRVYRKAFSVDEAVRMMREQRGRHFDPVLLDAFMEVLASSGTEARGQLPADPEALAENTLETFAAALERGDAEMAEEYEGEKFA